LIQVYLLNFFWPYLQRKYFTQELFPKYRIGKEDLPPFLQTWLDRTSLDCMFSSGQLKTWTSAHLRGVAWYLEYGPQHVPKLEVDKFKSLEAVGGVVLEDEALVGLDDKTRDKLIAQDKLKAEKVKDALEKTRLKEVERKNKQDEKAKEKSKKGKDKTEKGKDKKTNVQDEIISTILDEVLQSKSASNRGTKWDSSHLSATKASYPRPCCCGLR
jgi:hypothetical protein